MGRKSKERRKLKEKAPLPKSDSKVPDGTIQKYLHTSFLLAIVTLAFFLRLYQLGKESLWLDEAVSYFATRQDTIGQVFAAAAGDMHPPLHYVALWAMKFVGEGEFWLRFPSAIAGGVTVVVVYMIAAEVTDRDSGLIAAMLLAVSPLHLFYSQEARMYAFAVLFVSLAFYAFFRSVKSGRVTDWLVFGGALALSFYSHFYTSYAIFALVVSYFVYHWSEFRYSTKEGAHFLDSFSVPKDFKYFALGLVVAFILVLPILGTLRSSVTYFGTGTFNWGLKLLEVPTQTIIQFSFTNPLIAILLSLLACGGFFILWTRDRRPAYTMGALFWIILVISIIMAFRIPFNIRYHLYLISIFFILGAIALKYLTQKVSARYGVYGLILCILLISTIPLSSYYSTSHREDWRTFASNLREVTQDGDTIVPMPVYMIEPFRYYYDNRSDGTVIRKIAHNQSGFESLNDATGSVYFFVTWDIFAADPSGYAVAYLQNHTETSPGGASGILLLKMKR